MTAALPPPQERLSARIAAAAGLAAAAAPGALAACVALTLLLGGFPVLAAWLTRTIINDLAGTGIRGETGWLAAGLAAVGLATAVAQCLGKYLRATMERAIAVIAKERLFAATERFVGLRHLEDPVLLDRLRIADLSGGKMPNEVVEAALGVLGAALTVVGFLGSLIVVSPLMAAIVLLSGLPVSVAELKFSTRRALTIWDITPAERREIFYSDLLVTAPAGKEIRLFGLSRFFRDRMLAERRTADAARRRLDQREFVLHSALGAFTAVVSGAGLVWAVAAARSGRLNVGDIAMFVASVAGVQTALATVAQQMAKGNEALLVFDHYLAMLRSEPDLPLPAAPVPVPPLRHGIELRDVWFRYDERHPWVLRGVNLTIPYGRSVALVGLNGAGKSTLVKLLCRFYDPTRGAVLWDGVDIRSFAPDALRDRISAVFQDYMDYELTAAECVGVGDLSALDGPAERIEAAARLAGVHDTLAALPDGYDTLMSRRFFSDSHREDQVGGVSLSGGQRQRIALARAFLRESRDLAILDEPSAGLDAAAEHEVHIGLRTHRHGLTSLLISHRLSAVREADLIVVLSGGTVTELGDHDELMATGGEYARLFTLQAAAYQEAVPR